MRKKRPTLKAQAGALIVGGLMGAAGAETWSGHLNDNVLRARWEEKKELNAHQRAAEKYGEEIRRHAPQVIASKDPRTAAAVSEVRRQVMQMHQVSGAEAGPWIASHLQWQAVKEIDEDERQRPDPINAPGLKHLLDKLHSIKEVAKARDEYKGTLGRWQALSQRSAKTEAALKEYQANYLLNRGVPALGLGLAGLLAARNAARIKQAASRAAKAAKTALRRMKH
jgi:hypothetical protein